MSLTDPYSCWPNTLKGYAQPEAVIAARHVVEGCVGIVALRTEDLFSDTVGSSVLDATEARRQTMRIISDNFTVKK